MADKVQDQEQELSERQKILRRARRWHATDTWLMTQDEFRALARTGEFAPPEQAPEQGG
jgi:hypothetical protein